MTLDKAIKMYTNNAEYERTHGSLQGCLEFRQLAEWLKELEQLREQTRWIPASERLPEEKQDVLACFYTGNGNYKLMVSCRVDYNYWEGVGRTGDMVAWMPLPESYKGE